jgi:hypothetical protein
MSRFKFDLDDAKGYNPNTTKLRHVNYLKYSLQQEKISKCQKYSVFAVLRTHKKYLMNWADKIKVTHTSSMTTR